MKLYAVRRRDGWYYNFTNGIFKSLIWDRELSSRCLTEHKNYAQELVDTYPNLFLTIEEFDLVPTGLEVVQK